MVLGDDFRLAEVEGYALYDLVGRYTYWSMHKDEVLGWVEENWSGWFGYQPLVKSLPGGGSISCLNHLNMRQKYWWDYGTVGKEVSCYGGAVSCYGGGM
jgi:hypothetical protein